MPQVVFAKNGDGFARKGFGGYGRVRVHRIRKNRWELGGNQMSRVFVIPDIHLKPWILDKAEEELSKAEYDHIVFLGDLVDDWNQGENPGLYRETFDAVVRFIEKHPNVFFCYGNHDISYEWDALETGYSPTAKTTVLDGLSAIREILSAEKIAFVHRIDNVLFSHAGLMKEFVDEFVPGDHENLDDAIGKVNSFGKDELWKDVSPIWARPQYGFMHAYPKGVLQVVGHTPVEKTDYLDGIITVDNFSTFSNGMVIGDQRFIWVDTITMQWGFTDKGDVPEELPDARLDYRNYSRGDRVTFRMNVRGTDAEELHEGTVTSIDRFPSGEATIDVKGKDCYYKHISLHAVVEHSGG